MRSSWHKKSVHQRQLLRAFDALEQLVCHSCQAAALLGGPQYVQIKQGSQLPLAHDVSALASTHTQQPRTTNSSHLCCHQRPATNAESDMSSLTLSSAWSMNQDRCAQVQQRYTSSQPKTQQRNTQQLHTQLIDKFWNTSALEHANTPVFRGLDISNTSRNCAHVTEAGMQSRHVLIKLATPVSTLHRVRPPAQHNAGYP
jgi:hypothetical protein